MKAPIRFAGLSLCRPLKIPGQGRYACISARLSFAGCCDHTRVSLLRPSNMVLSEARNCAISTPAFPSGFNSLQALRGVLPQYLHPALKFFDCHAPLSSESSTDTSVHMSDRVRKVLLTVLHRQAKHLAKRVNHSSADLSDVHGMS